MYSAEVKNVSHVFMACYIIKHKDNFVTYYFFRSLRNIIW